MSENRSKKPQALKEFFSLQDEYDQKELTAEEEKEFEFHRCGGVLFGSLSDLRVDVSEEIVTFVPRVGSLLKRRKATLIGPKRS